MVAKEGLLKLPARIAKQTNQEVAPIPAVIPMEPETINRIMQAYAGERPGEFFFPNYQLTFLVPAGHTVVFVYNMPRNFVCTRQVGSKIRSDYYSPDIQVNLSVDGRVVTPYPAALTEPFDFDYGEHYVKRRDVTIQMTNNSARDAHLTFFTFCSIIHVDVYERWYRLLIAEQVDCLNACTLEKGGRRL
jgi:hypothetical protein